MKNLLFGLKQPEPPDRGFWSALENNIVIQEAHQHTGIDSYKIVSSNLNKNEVTVSINDWVNGGVGELITTMTLPSGYSVDETSMTFLIVGGSFDGQIIYPTIRKLSTSEIEIEVNRALDLKVILI